MNPTSSAKFAAPLAPRDPASAALFSVLTLDGGGARGYLTLKILEQVEAYLNGLTGAALPLGAHFDLVCGTSTGGIIALALALGRPVSEVSALYEAHLPRIFGPAMRRWAGVDNFRPRYCSDALREAMRALFGDLTLGDVQTDVCITALSLANARPQLFRSDYAHRGASRIDGRLVDLALAASAAPTFFAAHSTEHWTDLVDGGLYANNPALLGVVESFRFSRKSRRGVAPPYDLGTTCLEQLAVLSVGTGEQCAMPFDPDRLRTGGQLAWGRHFHSVSSESQSQYVNLLAEGLLGAAYHRINPRLDFPMGMDELRRLPALKNLADLAEHDEAFLRTRIAATVDA
ncbi:CBASS cGAMP-activated phospholipase [Pseudoxanthomonas sp. SE1]|uniref:CBASS cGAMP-activated phospholipase n=1 Tax=Pseudoxanthomonas sp. SE1 TaxID=1664560 RepID=UPI00240DB628|nr:CBASS cGAMP-activated phospholipase [Pseudoxanthomonas sp. SE1]WFC40270.1 CBASS cGAMP-activated phospholipase [Pseudoxanthomonas sp. SE1]WFC43727.1 CBASS cGAMP-activated phospholipase [Pseudoxanthomonas sp. SE1]